LLTFLDTDDELNPVLAGYFCKLFQVLVGNKPKEVFTYVYQHPEVIEKMIKHIYQKSVSEVLIRLLNVSENVLDSDCEISAADMDSVRQSFVFRILQRLSPEHNGSFEDHLNV
jgi:serine/threonine-protein phosphatase 6 regulatory subunit 3